VCYDVAVTRPVAPMSFVRQPLDAILSGTASVRVLRALLAHNGPLAVSRRARDTRLTPNGTRDALRALERTGVVESFGSGRTLLFAGVREHPVIAALDALFTAERTRFDDILASIKVAAAIPPVAAAWLFGSVARGEDGVGSDFDVAVVIDKPASEVSAAADAVRDRIREHERRLGFAASIVPMSPADLRRLRSERAPLWTGFARDARVLIGPSPAGVTGPADATPTHSQEERTSGPEPAPRSR
jgi:predicted nucleotidyltransferase